MPRARMIQALGLLCFVALVFAAATRVPAINDGRRDLNIRGSASPIENAPPEYAFAIQVFGAFRGLITDVAFIRAEMFKEQGRYYDAMQLATWICKLQPHFPSVWSFASWNMAWNISVTTFTPEERWNWVYNGVKLLRDHGIPLNPRAVNLYRQLAWTFNNKMSEMLDEQHYAYKCNWAWRMHLLLGPPPDPLAEPDLAQLADSIESPDDVDLLEEAARTAAEQHEEKRRRLAEAMGQEYTPQQRGPQTADQATETRRLQARLRQQAAVARLQHLADAPRTLDALYEQHPPARQMVADLRRLRIEISDDTLSEDDYWRPEGLAFAFFWPYQQLVSADSTYTRIARRRPDEQRQAQLQDLGQILGVSDENPAGEALVRFLQSKVLREVYRLDPEHMLYLTRTFGPIDWRAVDSQSLYWTSRGLIAGGETLNDYLNDKTNTTRVLFFSLRNLFLYGRITFEPHADKIYLSYLSRGIDMAFAEPMHQAYIRYGRLIDPDTGELAGAGDTFKTGHVNFLTEVITNLYLSGLEDEAARYYEYLQVNYPTNSAGQPNPALSKTLYDYVIDRYLENLDVPGIREIMYMINGFLNNACDQLAQGNRRRYVQLVRRAQEIHEDYMGKKRGVEYQRLRLPEFLELQTDMFHNWFRTPALTHVATLRKVKLWKRAPLYLRQSVYDALLPLFRAECEHWDFDLAEAFPEPKGMDEFRADQPERYREDTDTDVRTVPQSLSQ